MIDDINKLSHSIQEGMEETARLIALREQRRADPNYKGCDFCFDTAIGRIGTCDTIPCPEHNGLCI
jgi:hypothetical protein